MNLLPKFRSAATRQHFQLGQHTAIVLSDIEPANTLIQYRHVVAVFEKGSSRPCFVVASEFNPIIDRAGRSSPYFLCVFEGLTHSNLDQSDRWADEATFTAEALKIITEHFGTVQ